MSRTRLVRPGFFADEDVASMSRDSRLAYVGLWTECDDAGYFEARPRQLARALFGYDADGVDVVQAAIADLVRLGKVELLACGEHGIVPSLPRYAQQGGNKAFNHRSTHTSEAESGHVRTRLDPAPARTATGRVRTASEQVRTPGPDKSRSESVSESAKKKNVPDEVVDVANEAREADDAAFLSDPNRAGRPRASDAPSNIRPPSRLESITPQWKTPPGPCRDYVHHTTRHRLVEGVAVCDACDEQLAATLSAPVNGAAAQDGLGLT